RRPTGPRGRWRRRPRRIDGVTVRACSSSLGAFYRAAGQADDRPSSPVLILLRTRQEVPMKITDVKAVQVDHGPGPRPFSDGGYRDQRRVFGYVELFTDEGLTGFCPGAAPPSLVEQQLKEVIVGLNPLDVEYVWHQLFQGWRHPKMDDLMAISKIDLAVWDVVGKALGQPVWRLLGGARDRVRAYGAGGMYMRDNGIPELVAELVDFAEHSFDAVKMKVAGAPFEEDVARVKAVREAIGPRVDLLIDANHAWTP